MIKLKTYYPRDFTVFINNDINGEFKISWSNPEPVGRQKINNIEMLYYFGQLLKDADPDKLKKNSEICFLKDFIWMENIRDIFCGRINELIDNNNPFSVNAIGAFGDVNDPNKPIRGSYWELCKKNPTILEMNITRAGGIKKNNYSFDEGNPKFMSLLDLKKYKYILDLPGHSYSTKIFWKLFMKRPIFYIANSQPSNWELKLQPWEHYIPVKKDLSDLIENYCWAEKNAEKCGSIMNNGYKFALENLTERKIREKFRKLVCDD